MAVDEALLTAAIERQRCSLRVYCWQEPTLSVGYFQRAEAVRSIPEWKGLPVVRRLSGGGAILHHHEWTYSCALPAGHPLAAAPHEAYRIVHERVVGLLRESGVTALLRGPLADPAKDSFLCFGRDDPRDVVVAGRKILGSAQRRRKGCVLQHGSLLLRRSPFATEHPGLFDLDKNLQWPDEFHRDLATAISQALGSRLVDAELSPHDREVAAALAQRRYCRPDWGRRQPVAS